ncbi:TetR/AcrR family transcriptional regulator [Rhizobium laguerreae]|uniref:TetR/AcrR family transcriptional regulator n=1 Tax=Rhizobium laguerreae TaxID=1076926 RepID=UPI001C909896|nr:TetR/AcrR family transcriptional regulator [Rhizobium laguerreae]MBY3308156.1 TetR/AcrR family transcriptional regulator [Rhizobium laguerreae]
MRYPPDQKAKARAALLEAGARALRKNGFDGVGVDGLAAAAGVTSGAFYSNFANKEALLKDVVGTCLGEPFISATGTVQERRQKLREWLEVYISVSHRDHPESGCVMPTLSADIARARPVIRETYSERMNILVDKIAEVLSGDEMGRKRRAWNIVALMVGAVSIAQALSSPVSAKAALSAALDSASQLID